MFTDYKAKRILRKYAEKAYKERVSYIDSMMETDQGYFSRISFRQMGKRFAILTLVLILTFALFVVSASALGIKLFNFSFFNKADHVEIVHNEKDDSNKETMEFYNIGYVPEGYNLVEKKDITDVWRIYTYENSNEEYLYIEQAEADSYVSNIDNENCSVSKETIREMETYIYNHGEYKVYMMENEGLIITIQGNLSQEEFHKIIYELNK